MIRKISIFSWFHGWLLVNKPSGVTSNSILLFIKNIFPSYKIGFIGTLDPLASGLLPFSINNATKATFNISKKKKYIFRIKWGCMRNTDDIKGNIIQSSFKKPNNKDIQFIIKIFLGEIKQTPPIYSAKKINGNCFYNLARRGKNIFSASDKIFIHSLFYDPVVDFFYLVCSEGVYIRSLVRDIGILLNVYSCVSFLKRIAVGNFSLNQSISYKKLKVIKFNVFRHFSFIKLIYSFSNFSTNLINYYSSLFAYNKKLVLSFLPNYDNFTLCVDLHRESIIFGCVFDFYFYVKRICALYDGRKEVNYVY